MVEAQDLTSIGFLDARVRIPKGGGEKRGSKCSDLRRFVVSLGKALYSPLLWVAS